MVILTQCETLSHELTSFYFLLFTFRVLIPVHIYFLCHHVVIHSVVNMCNRLSFPYYLSDMENVVMEFFLHFAVAIRIFRYNFYITKTFSDSLMYAVGLRC